MRTLLITLSLTISINALGFSNCLAGSETLRQFDIRSKRLKPILTMSEEIKQQIVKVVDSSLSKCSLDQFAITSHSINGEIFHAVHSSFDECDGGNSYGIIYDDYMRPVAYILDSDLECIKNELQK